MFEYRSPKCVNIGDLSFTLVSMGFVLVISPQCPKKQGYQLSHIRTKIYKRKTIGKPKTINKQQLPN